VKSSTAAEAVAILASFAVLGGCSAARPAPPGAIPWVAPAPLAKEDLPDLTASPLALADVLQAALSGNAGLSASEHSWEAARYRPEQVSSYPDPFVMIDGSVKEVVSRNGPVEGGLKVQQSIPFPGKLTLRGEVAEQEAFIAWDRYAAKGLDLVARVKQAYHDLYWAERALVITAESRALLEQILPVANRQFAVAQVTQQDVLRAEIELVKLKQDVADLQDMAQIARARLNRLLNRRDAEPLGSPAKIEVKQLETTLEELLERADLDRPALHAARRAIERSKQAKSLALLDFFPDFVASFGYSPIGRTNQPGAPDPGRDAWGFGLGLSIPLWWGKNQARLREREERLAADRFTLEQLTHDTSYEVVTLYFRVQIAHRQVELYRDSVVPLSRQALEVANTAYSAVPPKVDFESLIDNWRRVLSYELKLERSRADFQQRLAELERVVGSNLTNKVQK